VNAEEADPGAPAPARSVVLIGFMGVGKSVVGRALATSLTLPFIDTDSLIEEQSGPIPLLFAERGEAEFRKLEEEVVTLALEQARQRPVVIALGGGAVTSAAVRTALARQPHVAWLSASLEVLRKRVGRQGLTRPLAADPVEFARLFEQRAPLYAAASSARFENDGTRPPSELVAEIVAWAGEQRQKQAG
jgi:shikimate kinase